MSSVKVFPILLTLLLLTSCGAGTALPTPLTPAPISAALPTPGMNHEFAVIGYFPDYRALNPAWAKYLTDIIYFSAEPRSDGTLDTGRLDEHVLNQLHQLQGRYGTRVLISIGGWERSSRFAGMAADAQIRQKFVNQLAEYVHENKLDGVDFDWEFPENEIEFQNYILLLTEVHADFKPKGLLVSVALSPDTSFPLSAYAIVDRIQIMSYDRAPRHSTYEQALQDVHTFLNADLPPEKLVLGVPFYGRKLAAPYAEVTYTDIVSKYHPVPYLDEVDGIFFNGITTIQRKTCYARQNRLGGIMTWELAQDTTDGTSLLRAIAQASAKECSLN